MNSIAKGVIYTDYIILDQLILLLKIWELESRQHFDVDYLRELFSSCFTVEKIEIELDAF